MKLNTCTSRIGIALSALLLILNVGCNPEEATDAMKKAEKSAGKAADTMAKDASEMAKKGGEMASKLGEQAMGFLTPLKEKFGSLENLKDKPAELKTAVTDLIESLETKASELKLPEVVTKALAAAKEKLIALKQYLEGEAEQAKIDEHLKGVMDSVKSALGM